MWNINWGQVSYCRSRRCLIDRPLSYCGGCSLDESEEGGTDYWVIAEKVIERIIKEGDKIFYYLKRYKDCY